MIALRLPYTIRPPSSQSVPDTEEAKKKKKKTKKGKKAAEEDSGWKHLCFHPSICRLLKSTSPDLTKESKGLPLDWTGGLRVVSAMLNWKFDGLKDNHPDIKYVAWLLSACFKANHEALKVSIARRPPPPHPPPPGTTLTHPYCLLARLPITFRANGRPDEDDVQPDRRALPIESPQL